MKGFFILLALVMLAGCSGGGRVNALPAPVATVGTTSTKLQIAIPHASSQTMASRRSPAYVTSSTQSIQISISPSVSGFPMVANLTASSTGCTSTVVATVCDVVLTLPPGSYTSTFTTYDQTGGSGHQLSAAQSVPVVVTEGQANVIPLVLGAIPASVQLVPGSSGVTVPHTYVSTLPGGTSGTIDAYGLDADGNTIIGAGAPTISASSDNSALISVTQPTASAPNAVSVTSAGASAIAHVTFTVTPTADSGASLISRSITVQPPAMSLIYLVSYGVTVFDQTGTIVATFPSSGWEATGGAYNPTNGWIYIGVQIPSNYVFAMNTDGVQQTLTSPITGLSSVLSVVFDPANNLLYVNNEGQAYAANGQPTALSNTIGGSYGMTYDPTHNRIVAGTYTYNADGSAGPTLGFSGQITGVSYSPYNGYFYVASVYPTEVNAYDTNGNLKSLSGSFPSVDNGGGEIGAIGVDPDTGNVFVSLNTGGTLGFDANGNALGAPWHNSATGDPLDVGSILFINP